MVLHLIAILLYISLCTSANHNFTGDRVSDRREYPFQVSIRQSDGAHFCGGVIYSENLVLTSAQCIYSPLWSTNEEIRVVVGDLQLNGNTSYTKTYEVQNVEAHKNFENSTFENDIAVIEVKGLFHWSDYVKATDLIEEEPLPDTPCTISGWGASEEQQWNATSNDLLFEVVYTLEKTDCKTYLKHKITFSYSEMLCAISKSNHFHGDTGGPLMCNNTLAGIISGPMTDNGISTYTNLDYYRDWIALNHSRSLIHSTSCILLLLHNTWLIYFFTIYKF